MGTIEAAKWADIVRGLWRSPQGHYGVGAREIRDEGARSVQGTTLR